MFSVCRTRPAARRGSPEPRRCGGEVRHQHLDGGGGRALAHGGAAAVEAPGAAVRQIVAVHRGDDHALQRACPPHRPDAACWVQRVAGTLRHVAERAARIGADDHERGGALAEALAHVGAGRFLAHRRGRCRAARSTP